LIFRNSLKTLCTSNILSRKWYSNKKKIIILAIAKTSLTMLELLRSV